MIIFHAGRLHQRVADSRADKFESALNEVAAHGVGFRCACRDLSHSPPTILLRFVADKAPEVTVETAVLFANREKGVRILDRRRNLKSVAHDPDSPETPFQLT